MRILAVCGSLQETSSNLTLLRRAAELAPDGAELVLFDGLRDLPLFNPDIERDGATPAPVTTLREAVADADALLLCWARWPR